MAVPKIPLVTALLAAATTANALSATVPAAVPTSASDPVDKAFCGFAFEESSFYEYMGTPKKPNDLSKNLINAVANRTKVTPIIRVGGTSLDNAIYNKTQDEAIIIPKDQQGHGIPKNISLGPAYFDAFKVLPSAQYILDIPMAVRPLNMSIDFASDGYKAIGKDNMYALELGNEPDYYGGIHRPKDWKVADYAKEWAEWTQSISKKLGLKEDSPIWEAYGALSKTKQAIKDKPTSTGWAVDEAWKAGLDQVAQRMKAFSMHFYQVENEETSNHAAVVKVSKYIKEAVEFLNKQDTKVPLVLAEAAVSVGEGDGDALGSALIGVDFMLHTMSIGVARINYQSGFTFKFNLWDVDDPSQNIAAKVRPVYYSQLLAAEFIGTSGKTRVSDIDTGSSNVTAYGAYDDGKLARIALANFEPSSSRAQNVTLDFGKDSDATKVDVKILKQSKGGAQVTWGGMTWTAENNGVGKHITTDSYTRKVQDGVVKIEVGARQAVLATLK